MQKLKTGVLLLGFLICVLTAASLLKPTSAHRQNPPAKPAAREDAYRANNLGVALLEQFGVGGHGVQARVGPVTAASRRGVSGARRSAAGVPSTASLRSTR